MRKMLFLSIFFVFVTSFAVLTSTGVLAVGEISLSFDPSEIIVASGDVKDVTVTVTNNQDKADILSVSIFPTSLQGVTTSFDTDRVSVNSHSSGKVKISFSAGECVEEFSHLFTVGAQSLASSSTQTGETLEGGLVQTSGTVKVTTERTFQVCIADVKFDKDFVQPGQATTVTVSITNPAESNSLPVTLVTTVKSITGENLQTFTDRIETVQGRGTSQISHQYTFNQFSASGFYTFQVLLKDDLGKTVSEKSIRYRVGSVEKISQTKDVVYGFLSQKIIIKVRNDGNEPVNNVLVKEIVPAFMKLFFFPKDPPTAESTVGSQTIYTWLIPTILPGEEKQITYELSIWYTVLVIIGIILLVLIAFRYAFTIRIVKSYKKFVAVAGAKEIQVQLEVRNRTRHVMKDVLVRDYLPASAQVVEKFGTLRPIVKKTLGGTELSWKFDALKQREERVITYNIKPVMEIVGEIRLPKANVRYMDHNREYRKSVSKHLIVTV
ncbi:MAG TPA: hypothetical protein VJJ76_00810 [archaeon]|nr:hypothetical protein [archaeon]